MDYFNDYGYGYGSDFFDFLDDPDVIAVLGTFFVVVAVFALIALAIKVTLYIFRSLALYKMATHRGMGGAALAWIPGIGSYRIGSVADDIAARSGSRTYFRHILLAGGIVNTIFPLFYIAFVIAWVQSEIFSYGYQSSPRLDGFILNSGISSLSSLIALAVYVVRVIALYNVYKCYRPQSATLWTVFSAIPFTAFLYAIFLFIIRDVVPTDAWNPPAEPYNGNPDNGNPAHLPPSINWQPPQYEPYGPPQNADHYQQPPVQPAYPPQDAGYQPPVAPNPPEPWEIPGNEAAPPPTPPWENGGR